MAAEFHRKTAALFEEFKNRELHFLKTDLNLKSNMNWKDNAPLQEYMQKINKREQETERTYKNLMKQMEELGQKTDHMTLKLEKLNALRNVALSSNIPVWPSNEDTYDRPFYSYYSNALLQTTPKILSFSTEISDFPTRIQPEMSSINNSYQVPFSRPNYNSITTQTEYIFCDNCHFPLILNSEMPISNVNSLSKHTHKTSIEKDYQHPYQEPVGTQENIDSSKETIMTKSNKDSHCSIPKTNYNFSEPLISDHVDPMFMNERVTSKLGDISLKERELINEQIARKMSKTSIDIPAVGVLTNEPFQKRISESYTENAISDEQTNQLVHRRISQSYIDNVDSDDLNNIPLKKCTSETYSDNAVTDDYVTHTEEKQYVEIEDNDLLSNDGNFEQIISKSDDESMTHEFNFLDSDKGKVSRRQPFHQMTGDNQNKLTERIIHNERHGNTQLEANSSVQSNSNQVLKAQQISGSGGNLEVNRKDLSGPPSPSVPSENASVVSESDSFSEKETPLSKTAAYQAMLGNVSVAKPQQKSAPISDTDTEDEIENALANAVRRTSHIAFETSLSESKTEKRKESIADIKTEKNNRPVNSVSTNKPQNKLSKNTRKVLGLDTSSGSEVELEVKSPTSKIEEESDEFDFYD